MKKTLFILLASAFLDILGFSFVLPVIPFIVNDLGGSAFMVGISIGVGAAGMLIGGLGFGRLSDKFGRKKILILSIFLNIIGYILFGLSNSIKLFLIARLCSGLGGGGVSVLQAYIGDISDHKNRITNMGYLGAVIGLGFGIGPIIGGLLQSSSLQEMGFISAIILGINLMIIFFLPNYKIQQIEKIKLGDITHSSQKLLILFIIFFIITASFTGIQTIFSLFLNNVFDFTPKQISFTFGFVGIIVIIYQIFFIKKVFEKIKEKGMIKIGIFMIGISMILIGINKNLYLLYLILPILGIGISNTNSAVISSIISLSNSKSIGKNMGINTAFGSVADILGPLVSGYLYTFNIRYPFYFFSLILIILLSFLQIQKKS